MCVNFRYFLINLSLLLSPLLLHATNQNSNQPTALISYYPSGAIGNTLFLGTQANGVFMSRDDGNSWQPTNLPVAGVTINHIAGGSSFRLFALALNSEKQLFSQQNTEASYQSDTRNLPYTNNITLLAAPPSAGYYVGYDQHAGIFMKTINVSANPWQSDNAGLDLDNIARCNTMISADTIQVRALYLGTSNGIYRKKLNSSEPIWQHLTRGLPEQLDVTSLAVLQNIVYLGTQNRGLYRSADGGESWQHIDNFAKMQINRIFSLGDILLYVDAGENHQLYRTDIGTSDWLSLGDYRILAVNNRDYRQVIYAIPNQQPDSVYKSEDFGFTWQKIWGDGLPVRIFK